MTPTREQCRDLLGRLPDAGLAEAHEMLTEMVGFWSVRRPAPVPTAALPPIPATLGAATIRPVYPIGEDP